MLSKNKIFIDINSKDRKSGTDGNFVYHLDIPNDRRFDHVCLVGATIPKSYYLIPAGGNTFILREDAKEVVIEVPVGNYNRRNFSSVVKGLLNANSPNNWKYDITYPSSLQPDTGKFTYLCTSSPDTSALIMPARSESHLFEQFGFDAGSTNVFSSNKLESRNVVKFSGNDSVFVRSNICMNGSDNVLHGINAVSTESFSDISHECTEIAGYSKMLSIPGAGNASFSVTDENGKALEFNGLSVILRIVIYQSENVYDIIKQGVALYDAQSDENISA